MSVLDAIGNTPLVEMKNIWDPDNTGVRIMAKLEGSNPGGSVKDRPAYFMLKDAMASGKLTQGKIILEPTSGNTGIGMAMVAAAMGFKIKLTMPTCVSTERQAVLQALGAELELTPGCDRTDGAISGPTISWSTKATVTSCPTSSTTPPTASPITRPPGPRSCGRPRRGRCLRGRHGHHRHPHGLLACSSRK